MVTIIKTKLHQYFLDSITKNIEQDNHEIHIDEIKKSVANTNVNLNEGQNVVMTESCKEDLFKLAEIRTGFAKTDNINMAESIELAQQNNHDEQIEIEKQDHHADKNYEFDEIHDDQPSDNNSSEEYNDD